MKSRFDILTIVEAGMMLALAVGLNFIKTPSLPFGGSVTAGSMIPILLVAMMRGPIVGITVGVLFGVIDYLFGGSGWFLSPLQWLMDYPLAFGALGVAGFFGKAILKRNLKGFTASLIAIAAAVIGIGLRFVSHFLAGIWFWRQYAPEGTPVWLYSLGYQASYLVPEIILSGIILAFLIPALGPYLRQRA